MWLRFRSGWRVCSSISSPEPGDLSPARLDVCRAVRACSSIAKGRSYYLAAAYPMLIAAGAVVMEQWLAGLSIGWSRLVQRDHWRSPSRCGGVVFAAVALPIAPINSALVEHGQRDQRRIQRRDRLAGTGGDRRQYLCRSAAEERATHRHPDGQLRRSRSHQPVWPSLRSAQGD